MLRPTLHLLPFLFLTFACDKSSSTAGASASASAAASASPASTPVSVKSATTTASASPAVAAAHPSATPSAASSVPANAKGGAAACAALEWDKEGDTAKATSFKGKIGNGEGSNATGTMEKFQTIILDKPVCAADKSAVSEIQLYTNEKSIDLKKMVGKNVTIEGEPFTSHTAHHHTPIVVEVKKLTAQ